MSTLSLATMRTLTYTYLGTSSADPLYTTSVLNTLINNAASKFLTDLQEARPDYFSATITLNSTAGPTNTYNLPSDFSGWLEVRTYDYTGIQLNEVRLEELNVPAAIYCFALTGADQNGILQTSPNMAPGIPLYFRYQVVPPDLAADGDIPSWMPSRFHDLIPRQAAIDGYGIGNEDVPAELFVQETNDRLAQYYQEITRRGVGPFTTRGSSPP